MTLSSKKIIFCTIAIGLVILISILPPHTADADLLMRPYLMLPATDHISILVECDTYKPVTVEYGLTSAYGFTVTAQSIEETNAAPATYIHNILLTGLQAGTLYHYRTVQGMSVSSDLSFRTPARTGDSFRMAVTGDFRTGVSIHNQIAGRIYSENPQLLLYSGDTTNLGDYAGWKTEFFVPNELVLLSHVPFVGAIGNHEWKPIGSLDEKNYKAFLQPMAIGTPNWFSFDYGDMHVLVLDTNTDMSVGSSQYNFAQVDLSTSSKPWKFVLAHRGPYVGGGHGENPSMITLTTDIFEPQGVDVVFVGDSHFYQHNLVNGIHHMVVASAGAPLADPVDASYTIKSVKDYAYAVVDISPAAMQMVIRNVDNLILDTIQLSRTPSPLFFPFASRILPAQ